MNGTETCAADYDGEGVAWEITDGTMIFYESECVPQTVVKLQTNSYRLDLTCQGEGRTWRSSIMLSLLPKSKVNEELLLEIDLKKGTVSASKRCE